MDWRNSNDDLTRQSDARRERENQRFENGISGDRGGFGGMRQGPGGDPLARMRGAQPDPFVLWCSRWFLFLVWFVYKICNCSRYIHFACRRWSEWWYFLV